MAVSSKSEKRYTTCLLHNSSPGAVNIFIEGDLLYRMTKNFQRLHEKQYQPQNLFKTNSSWPGDYEGHTILGWILLGRSLHREPEYLEYVMSLLEEHTNIYGYFGDVLEENVCNEQLIAGNNWFLRALIEYYSWKGDQHTYSLIHSIIENLLLKIKVLFQNYPVITDKMDNGIHGEAVGAFNGNILNGWKLSSDTGCAFIMLDAATAAYGVIPSKELDEVIRVMIEAFVTTDFQMQQFQTHATLSALRGILRFISLVQEHNPDYASVLLGHTMRIFDYYTREAMTENYANFNWFGRPDSWTEPCAFVDSFIVSYNLWSITGKHMYLELAHKIYYNAMGYGQRPNGGWGCDVCAGVADEYISPKSRELYEAHWCCSMRGGEGLSKASEYVIQVADDTLTLPFYHNNVAHVKFRTGDLVLRQTTSFPYKGNVKLDVIYSSLQNEINLKMFIPSWVEEHKIHFAINGKDITPIYTNGFLEIKVDFDRVVSITLDFPVKLLIRDTLNPSSQPGFVVYQHGFLILGSKITKQQFRDFLFGEGYESCNEMEKGVYRFGDIILHPINDMIHLKMEDSKGDRRKILFHRSDMPC